MQTMKFLDRAIGLDPSDCVEGNEPYEVYRAGLRGALVGGAALAGGLALKALTGVETGVDIAVAGFIVEGLGATAMVAGMENLESTREH